MRITKDVEPILRVLEEKLDGFCPCACDCSCLAHPITFETFTDRFPSYKIDRCGHCQAASCGAVS